MKDIDTTKIKFCDEKSLKALEMIGLKARPDPYTGEMPGTLVPKDWKVKYSIIGICGIDPTMPPLIFKMQQENTTAAVFMDFMEDIWGE